MFNHLYYIPLIFKKYIKYMKIALTGGGSGGHTSSAIAFWEELTAYCHDKQVNLESFYIGSYDGIEKEVSQKNNIPYYSISTGKLRRYLSFKNFIDIFKVFKGLFEALGILNKNNPDILFSTGGFVSVPVVIAGWLKKIPIVIHEQTISIGLANKIASKFATTVCLSFKESLKYFPKDKVILTGPLVRSNLTTGSAEKCRSLFKLSDNLPLIYITGGSQGSHLINNTIKAILPELLEYTNIIHQCGKTPNHDDFKILTEYREALPYRLKHRYTVLDYVQEELTDIYARTNLLIGRAGAGTVSEAIALKIPCIFIPLKIATKDEQTKNAKVIADVGGAIIIKEDDLNSEMLKDTILNLFESGNQLTLMKQAIENVSIDYSSKKVLEIILKLAYQRDMGYH